MCNKAINLIKLSFEIPLTSIPGTDQRLSDYEYDVRTDNAPCMN